MKITDMRKNNKIEHFSDLRPGDVFLDGDEDINIKVEDESTNGYYAVMLENGGVWVPDDTCPVTKLNARLVIED